MFIYRIFDIVFKNTDYNSLQTAVWDGTKCQIVLIVLRPLLKVCISLTKRQVTTAGTWSMDASVKKMVQFYQKIEGLKFF